VEKQREEAMRRKPGPRSVGERKKKMRNVGPNKKKGGTRNRVSVGGFGEEGQNGDDVVGEPRVRPRSR